jgi:holo-[acyl-carrier protein] synthase
MVVGIGVDLFEIARMSRELGGRDPGLREELFTPGEIACCERAPDPMLQYAARFAAKEAAFKALAPAPGTRASFRDVEVCKGAREISLRGALAARAAALGVRRARLRLTRTRGLALAAIVLDG